MKTLISTTAIAVAIVSASGAAFGEVHIDPETMTCADFTGLELGDQEIAVAAIEATKMEMAESGLVDETADTTPEMEESSDGAAETSDAADPLEEDTEVDNTGAQPSPIVEDLLTACDGNDDALAIEVFGS